MIYGAGMNGMLREYVMWGKRRFPHCVLLRCMFGIPGLTKNYENLRKNGNIFIKSVSISMRGKKT